MRRVLTLDPTLFLARFSCAALLAFTGACQDSGRQKPAPTNQTAAPSSSPATSASATQPASTTETTRPLTPHQPVETDKLGTLPPGVGLRVGDKASNAVVTTTEGTIQVLSSLWAKGPLFLVFYGGGDSEFSNAQVRALALTHADLAKLGTSVALVSTDAAGASAKTKGIHRAAFPVLSDPSGAAHRAFKLAPSTSAMFLIDRTGRIRWAHADPDSSRRPTVQQMMQVARDTLKAPPRPTAP